MKILLFKVSTCSQCQKQEALLQKYGINYIPCELFKNRQLARRYNVTDVPTTLLIDYNNDVILRYNTTMYYSQLENLKNILG